MRLNRTEFYNFYYYKVAPYSFANRVAVLKGGSKLKDSFESDVAVSCFTGRLQVIPITYQEKRIMNGMRNCEKACK